MLVSPQPLLKADNDKLTVLTEAGSFRSAKGVMLGSLLPLVHVRRSGNRRIPSIRPRIAELEQVTEGDSNRRGSREASNSSVSSIQQVCIAIGLTSRDPHVDQFQDDWRGV